MKRFLQKYRIGIDLWGLALFGILMLPNIVYWSVPKFTGLGGNKPIDIAAIVFQAVGIACLLFLVKREGKKFSFSSPLVTFAGIFLMLYYIAWIFWFCAYRNLAVLLFLTACPCVSLILYEIFRENWFALVPTGVFAVLHILSVVLVYL